MKLFWVTTDDHLEDWFVIAPTGLDAELFFVREEGYDQDDAIAQEVLAIPEAVSCEKGWPTAEILIELGGTFLNSPNDDARVVKIAGETYGEGMLESLIRECNDDQFEMMGAGRPNQTVKKKKIVS